MGYNIAASLNLRRNCAYFAKIIWAREDFHLVCVYLHSKLSWVHQIHSVYTNVDNDATRGAMTERKFLTRAHCDVFVQRFPAGREIGIRSQTHTPFANSYYISTRAAGDWLYTPQK